MKLGREGKQITRNSLNQNILNKSRIFSTMFIFMPFLEILRTLGMVLFVAYFTRVERGSQL